MEQSKGISAVLAVLLIIILTAAGTAGGYYFKNQTAKQEKQSLQSEIESLKQELSELKETAKELTTTAPTTEETTKDETADWKTYTSSKWGYSIKYPSSYYIKGGGVQQYPGQEGAQDLIISDIEKMGIQDIMKNEKVHIDVLTSPSGGKFLTQFVNDYTLGGSITGKEEITLGQDKAIKQTNIGDIRSTIYIFTAKNNYIYILRGTSGNVNDDPVTSDNFKRMWKIMETFRFTS